MSRRTWLAAAAALLLGIIASALYVWGQRTGEQEFAAVASADPSCNLQREACQARFTEGAGVTLNLLPRPVESLQPLQIEVQVEGLAARAVAVDFRGLSMPMGYNRTPLESQSSNLYSGTGMLASCALERMSWEATVLAETDHGILAATFVFETLKP